MTEGKTCENRKNGDGKINKYRNKRREKSDKEKIGKKENNFTVSRKVVKS